MPKAVRFDHYGNVDVLKVIDVPKPSPSPGQVLVRVVTAGTNPGEIAIREGKLDKMFPSTFPSGQGTDFAGVVAELGDGVTAPSVGTPVIGWSNKRSAQSEFVAVPAEQLVVKPESLDWDVAGSLFVIASTAMASVSAVKAQRGETILVSGASGGVGSLTVQLVLRTGASVVGTAEQSHHDWLRSIGVTPVDYKNDLRENLIRVAPSGFDAVIDTVGHGYVDLAINMGIDPDRINTIIDFAAADKHKVHTDGSSKGESSDVLAKVAGLIADGELQVPVAAVYDLKDVRQAYTQLAEGHTGGKIVLRVSAP
ncbi:NADP-dependent oxidoreductase [Aetokthonos hydrillicola Thurmond2011]|jgi:NADPH:quinone reductase-like Zn-dependent oxidoreductase|uniref:NADP-dependent oxidoreductase n=1 Tax=Aetokthonos hydrillicola Thurmond2011 TaxID=2712845 RepID=A0AAP5M726_9CYAN|nr:NADP-dependent oxidoreductase [Aetokthonos hydrillicola]MBO3458372.1 NADP-dependent oxidoreductase [Aetokthonos hydrillicola CCALA 1050]MBW4586089.1 NADP-dependent oxidoreductase [Aetokthonos hydrillicola CCALA 1050]MDR9897696.1 NADP-dependent oxidoreductase [Aetokthonos hydrillicola Thurmond2011]